ncbi:lipoprotein NlpI [Vibrio stylophorae]
MYLSLTGCSALTNSSDTYWQAPPMAIPLQPTLELEAQLVRIDQILAKPDLNDDIRAQLYFRRGLVYDNLGLRDIARVDYEASLNLMPAQPEVYNQLGVYFTQSGEYDMAYQAFSSALELDQSHDFALRNRGIAFYYGKRYQLAEKDLLSHYENNPNDPYRILWLYLNEMESQPEQAKANLESRYQAAKKEGWGWYMVEIYRQKQSDDAIIKGLISTAPDNRALAERLCEAYFYLGKRYLHEGKTQAAFDLFKLAMAANVQDFVEHRYALLELEGILQTQMNQANAHETAK